MSEGGWTPIEWREEMSVGIAQLDDDHKGLIAIINRLGEATDGGDEAKATLSQAFRALKRYMQVHFAREEEAMRAGNYGAYEAHRGAHKAFIGEISDMADRFGSGGGGAVVEDLAAYLRDWLINHIMIEDMAYKPSLANNDKARQAVKDFSALGLWTG